MKIKYLLIFLFTINHFSFGQKNIWINTRISTTAGLIVSSDSQTPFLMRSLQYGTIPINSQLAYFSGSIKKKYDSLYTADKKLRKFDWGYEIEPHINAGKVNQILLPQAYIKVRYKIFEFFAGRRKEIQGLVDTSGTMGSYIWSGNALPLPKLDISIPRFNSLIPGGLIAIKGNYAHGWFGDGDSVKNYFLHQKSFYGRLGKPSWKIKVIAGFNHQVQWGGKPTVPFYDKISEQMISSFGSDISTYFNVVTGLSMGRLGSWNSQRGVPANEAGNRTGNHLGTVDVGAEINTYWCNFLIYRQNIYEDGSLFYLNNISDGLSGISFTPKKIKFLKKFTLEYLDTRSQGGITFRNEIAELRGKDNYFNNGIYNDSWRYRDRNLGSPLLIAENDQIEKTKKQNQNYFVNSKVKAINLKVSYVFSSLNFSTQILHSNNRGSLEFPINASQLSFKQDCHWKYKNYNFRGIISADLGEYWSQHAGLQLQIQKLWR